MAYANGITRYQKKTWLDQLTSKTTSNYLKVAIYTTTTGLGDGAVADPASAIVYTTSGELTASGTGYTAGGYTLATASVTADSNAYQITWADVVTGSGTIASGTYYAMVYDTNDSNKAVAFLEVTVSTGSSSGTMTFDFPAGALKLT